MAYWHIGTAVTTLFAPFYWVFGFFTPWYWTYAFFCIPWFRHTNTHGFENISSACEKKTNVDWKFLCSPYSAELFVFKQGEQVFFHFEISINVLVTSIRFIWIHMLLVYGHFSYSTGINFRHQNLTSTDVTFRRLKSVHALKGLWPHVHLSRAFASRLQTRYSSTMIIRTALLFTYQGASFCRGSS